MTINFLKEVYLGTEKWTVGSTPLSAPASKAETTEDKTYHCENPLARGVCWLRSWRDRCVSRNLTEPGVDESATVGCGIAGRLVQCSTIVSGVVAVTAAPLLRLADAGETSVRPPVVVVAIATYSATSGCPSATGRRWLN